MSRQRFDDARADGILLGRYLKLQGEVQTLGGNITIANESGVVNAYDAGGSSRTVTLPTRATTNDGIVRIFINLSTAGETLAIKNPAAVTILTIPPSCMGMVIASGTVEAPGTRAWQPFMLGGEASATITNTTGTLGNTNAAVSAIILALQAHGIVL